MKIGGFLKQSLTDYPGNISAVVYTQGCNFRCGYCHIPELVLPERFQEPICEEEFWTYLKSHSHLLDAVCITGGEPCLQKDLGVFIHQIKKMGLKVKLDTNGSSPEMIKTLLDNDLVDFIAMSIKHVLNIESYSSVVGFNMSKTLLKRIEKTIQLIRESDIEYDFTTTEIKGFHTNDDIKLLKQEFGRFYKVQYFEFGKHIVNPDLYSKLAMLGSDKTV